MSSLRACAILLGAVVIGACPTDEPQPLKLRVTSELYAEGAARLDALRVLLWQDGRRFPSDAAAEAANFPLAEPLDPTVAPIVLDIDYGRQTFATPVVLAQVTGRLAGVPITHWEGELNLASSAVVDVALTVIDPACDADKDGFLACGLPGCCEAQTALSDCGPDDDGTHPWILEDACEPCDDVVDNDCDGQDLECVDADGDTVADCLEQDCGLGDPDTGPGLPEICDSVDNDCDGLTDEELTGLYKGDVISLGADCGTGACAGGHGVCAPDGTVTCSRANLEAAKETCGNGIDDNCDGRTDEQCGDDDPDGDGQTAAQGDCNPYDSAFYSPDAVEPCCPAALEGAPDVLERCDRNCDGAVTHCPAGDNDSDGIAPPDDCDDTDPLVYPGAPERCGDGIDQDCLADDLPCAGVVDGDGDGWSPPDDCDDGDATIHPGATETCDGRDEDCDGLIDDGNPDTNDSAACELDEGECVAGTLVCVSALGGADPVQCLDFEPPAAELCDGLDNDCDGETDEDFPDIGLPCDGDDSDSCAYGHYTCNPDGSDVECNNETDQNVVDACDGFDNDCDGVIDQGCAGQTCGALTIACPQGFACVDGACRDAGGRDVVFVPAGEALMGCLPDQPKCNADAQPQHSVSLQAFVIDRTEVPCSAYCGEDPTCAGAGHPDITAWCSQDPTRPVANVVWSEAYAWCVGKGGDLCTEAQWERAARTTLTGGVYDAGLRTFPWGEADPVCGVTAETGDSGAGCNDEAPSPADSLPAGASFFGVVNMAGNVAEWVADWHAADYYATGPAADPAGPDSGTQRVTRGSNWRRFSSDMASYIRVPLAPATRDDKQGIRCCYPPPDPTTGP